MKVVIVGGVAGGATAAARLRRLDEKAEIVILERSGFVSYANCGLPYYIGGVIEDKRALTLQTPESFRRRFRIDVRVRQEVTAIHPAEKAVTVRRLEDGTEYRETYDKLILSPGAKAIHPEGEGLDDPRVFTLRTVEDTYRIRDYVTEKKPRRAVVVGGGFIGLEMAENLLHAGVETTLLQRSTHVMPPLDADMASSVHAYLRDKGVDLRLNTTYTAVRPSEACLAVELTDGTSVETDLLLLAIGVTPDSHLAAQAGLELGAKGSIVVNERMETSQPDIYAVGDAVEVRHFVTGKPALIALAGPANKQGRIAADNICGGNSVFRGSQGSSVLKLFDMTIAATGINEKQAKDAGIAYEKTVTFSASHATYYPGSTDMTIKVLYEKDSGRVLGAQIVGFEGVDKRIDVLATAMQMGGKVTDLTELDLAYAPPYSSAKDPVNMAGFMIENLSRGLVAQFFPEDVDALPRDGSATLLDVRTPGEYAAGHAEGFVNLPVDDLREHLAEIPADKPVYLICQSALRSYIACRILSQHGLRCSHLSGGWRLYTAVMQDQAAAQEALPCGMEK